MNTTGVNLIYMFFYNTGQLYLPNFKKLFGSSFRYAKLGT